MTVVAKLARVSALARSESLGDFRYGQIGQLLRIRLAVLLPSAFARMALN